MVFGSGAALTLDEFALWLNLADDYWNKQGRESIDAVVLFGSLLSVSVLGKGFFRELLQHARTGRAHAARVRQRDLERAQRLACRRAILRTWRSMPRGVDASSDPHLAGARAAPALSRLRQLLACRQRCRRRRLPARIVARATARRDRRRERSRCGLNSQRRQADITQHGARSRRRAARVGRCWASLSVES